MLKNFNENRKVVIVALVIAGIMLFVADSEWPYGYYTLLRWVVSVSGLLAAYIFYKHKNIYWTLPLGFVVLLFNPIVPVHLEREDWRLIDLFTSVFYFVTAYFLSQVGKVVKPNE